MILPVIVVDIKLSILPLLPETKLPVKLVAVTLVETILVIVALAPLKSLPDIKLEPVIFVDVTFVKIASFP